VRVPGKCKNFEVCGSKDWRDYDTELCRKCEIEVGNWGHNDTKAEDGRQVQEDDGLVGR